MPLRMNTFFTPGSARSLRRMPRYSLWSTMILPQGCGARQCLPPAHIPFFICSLQLGRRKFAVGPPTS